MPADHPEVARPVATILPIVAALLVVGAALGIDAASTSASPASTPEPAVTASPSPSPVRPATAPACLNEHIEMVGELADPVRAGDTASYIAVLNNGTSSCRVAGIPAISLETTTGREIATYSSITRWPVVSVADTVLLPGERALSLAVWTDWCGPAVEVSLLIVEIGAGKTAHPMGPPWRSPSCLGKRAQPDTRAHVDAGPFTRAVPTLG